MSGTNTAFPCSDCGRCPLVNFHDETVEVIESNGLTVNDVLWIGGSSFTIPINDFWTLSDFTYDRSPGKTRIPIDLTIVLNGGVMVRDEYDGEEWWLFKSMPRMPEEERSVTKLVADENDGDYMTLADLNPDEEPTEEPEEETDSND